MQEEQQIVPVKMALDALTLVQLAHEKTKKQLAEAKGEEDGPITAQNIKPQQVDKILTDQFRLTILDHLATACCLVYGKSKPKEDLEAGVFPTGDEIPSVSNDMHHGATLRTIRSVVQHWDRSQAIGKYKSELRIEDPEHFHWLKTVSVAIVTPRGARVKESKHPDTVNTPRQYVSNLLLSIFYSQHFPFVLEPTVENPWKFYFIYSMANLVAHYLFGYPREEQLAATYDQKFTVDNTPIFLPEGYVPRVAVLPAQFSSTGVDERFFLPTQTGYTKHLFSRC
jgi:hypothetical protein